MVRCVMRWAGDVQYELSPFPSALPAGQTAATGGERGDPGLPPLGAGSTYKRPGSAQGGPQLLCESPAHVARHTQAIK